MNKKIRMYKMSHITNSFLFDIFTDSSVRLSSPK